VNRNRHPGTGDLKDPSVSDTCLDSAWQLLITSIEGGTGKPGRMLGEIRKEHRDARKHNFLVPYHQVEFYEQHPDGRRRYYVSCPDWWRTEAWTSQPIRGGKNPIILHEFIGFKVLLIKTRFKGMRNLVLLVKGIAFVRIHFRSQRIFIERVHVRLDEH
jgi:hypothetical protein